MELQTTIYIMVGLSFALYIGIAVWARAGTTSEFYSAGGSVHPGPGVPMAALSGAQAAQAVCALVGQPGQQAQRVARRVAPGGVLHGHRFVHPQGHPLHQRLHCRHIGRPGAHHQGAMAGLVGQAAPRALHAPGGVTGVTHFNGGAGRAHGRQHLCARVGLRTRGQVGAQFIDQFGLHPDDHARAHVHLRLVEEHELAIFKGTLEALQFFMVSTHAAVMGCINIWVANHFDTDTWVSFKLFGGLGLMLVFVVAQGVYMSRYIQEKPEDQA